MEFQGNRSSFIFLFVIGVVLLSACQESEVKPQKPLTLNMDVPKPVLVKKSKVKPKSIPEIQKSDLKFQVTSATVKKDLSERPIKDRGSCNLRVDEIEKEKNKVQTAGGFWGRIESTKNFKAYSPIGVKVDAKINQLIFGLRHLCDTAMGLELTHVAKELIKESKGRTTEELVKMLESTGKAKADIEIYLKYVEFAKRSENRLLEYSSIQESVLWVDMFVDQYSKFFNGKLADKEHLDQAMPDVLAFKDALDRFSVENENIKIAIMEDFQVPYFYVTEM
jgi:hypothetical protein